MNKSEKNIKTEIATIKAMIKIYCSDIHKKKLCDCNECKELFDYAILKIEKCPHKIKPNCNDCKIHCYKIEMRERIKIVMRHSGKKMIYKHPILALNHFFRKK